MSDGYRVIRTATLAWLLERHRGNPEPSELPTEVARDLGEAVVSLSAPIDDDRIRAAGPLLSVEEHELLLLEELDLPRSKHDGQFWRLVLRVVHATLTNEAEAVLRVVAERSSR